jgi:hypothetical protein
MRKIALLAAASAVAAVILLGAPSVQAESPAADEGTAGVTVDEALVRQKVDQRLSAILRAKLRERAEQRAAPR